MWCCLDCQSGEAAHIANRNFERHLSFLADVDMNVVDVLQKNKS